MLVLYMEGNRYDDIASAFAESSLLAAALAADTVFQQSVRDGASILFERLTTGGTLYTAGNGGSAAEAQHLAGEFSGRFRRERPPFGAVALTAESVTMTAIGNDYSFDAVFARQLTGLGKPGDVFIALTTSGNSPNILEALKAARDRGVTTIALLGKGGGAARGLADLDIIVPSDTTARIQEVHLLVIHAMCEMFDTCLLGPSAG